MRKLFEEPSYSYSGAVISLIIPTSEDIAGERAAEI